MKIKQILFGSITAVLLVASQLCTAQKFNPSKDLLLAHFDCKTDVDDLHAIAAFATLLSTDSLKNIPYHAVAGTYGIQEGLYVPPNELFELAFGSNWTDANVDREKAVEKIKGMIKDVMLKGGNVWIAEAGQSDFTAAVLQALLVQMPKLNTVRRIHVVQHSDWNEKATSAIPLKFVKSSTTYHKIPDGNNAGNGSPGFLSEEPIIMQDTISNNHLKQVWTLAKELTDRYNGQDGRYRNKAIEAGGLDFSDLVEICWILDLDRIKDTNTFLSLYAR